MQCRASGTIDSVETLRLLTPGDLAQAFNLSAAAGWNQTLADWRRILALEPQACWAIECDGAIAATTTLLTYGADLAWLGLVLTHARYQRRGFARRLVTAALDYASRREIRTLKLDASDMGRPLYLELGFAAEQAIERWMLRREPPATHAPSPAPPFDPALDRLAFGADRTRFLAAVGFSVERPGSRAHYFGPLVSDDPRHAEQVIRDTIARDNGPWFWDLFPAHPHAPRIASELGFEPVRRLTRMVRGPQIETRDHLVYAIGGFEAG